MDLYESILGMTEKELEELVKIGQFRNKEDIHCAYELLGIAKRIYTIWACSEQEEPEGGGAFSRNSYDNGNSSRGSYRGGSYNGGSYDGYSNRRNSRRMSRDGGSYRYSRHDENEFVDKMKEMRALAPDEQTKTEIDRLLSQMGQ